MKVCSWNINSIRVRVNALNLLIEKHKPEIILLQEIKCENHQFEEFYKNADYICIDEPEFRLAMHDKNTPLKKLLLNSGNLPKDQ